MKSHHVFACLIATASACLAQPALGPILLDNFTSNRTNNSPPAQLWSAYLGEDPGQTFSIANGVMKVVGDPKKGCGATGCGLYPQFMEGGYIGTTGFAKGWIQSGTWNTNNVNRLRFKFRCNKTVHGNDNAYGHSWGYVGTYSKPNNDTNISDQGRHFYHTLTGDTFANRWNLVELNRHPQHEVGIQPDPGDNPTASQVNYFDGLTRFYFDTTNASTADGGADAWSGVACEFDDFYFDTVTNSPDDKVSNIVVNYDGAAYNLSFNSLPNVAETYNIRYSTNSMKAAGFNSGTDGGQVRTTQNDYTFMLWKSPSLPYSSTGMYIAIQPASGSSKCGSGCFTEVYYPPLDSSSSTTPPATSSCDVNGDGAVNQTDVNLAISSALNGGASPDLDGSGSTTVVDVQRIINASLGQSCRVGQ